MSTETEKKEKPGCLYHLFKAYVRFLHNKIFYKKTYQINTEAVPADGTPCLIVSNHQNCMNDPLGLVTSMTDRKLNVITRADVFMVSPVANKFLRSIGLLPAFRLDYEGEKALDKNNETFRQSEQALIDGATVLMYPEAGHQDKRWLGTFSFGYTKMAFEAAELANFEKEVFILPACNHYSHYFGMQNRMLVKFGTPISLQPYYELYKTKPRTAQREVNKLVREQISGLMLDIRDLDNYDAIDFIRTTYGVDYAKKQGVNPDNLPERLLTDKDLVARLDEAKAQHTEAVEALYQDALTLKQSIAQAGITDAHLKAAVNPVTLGFKLLALLMLLPLWIFSWWPSMLVYWIPMSIFKAKMKDPMFEGTLLFGSAVLFTLPLFSLMTLLVVGLNSGWLLALVYVALFPLLMLFCWKYAQWGKKTLQTLKCLLSPKAVERMKRWRKDMHALLDEALDILKSKK
jgi:1-acyl-sn-glycerol-3-phosphate acyltransferase